MKKLLVLSIALMVLGACASRKKKKSTADFPFDVIEVTANGGFAGTTTGFSIQKNAEISVIYHQPGKSYGQKFYRLSTQDSVNHIFEQVMQSGIYDEHFQKTGNMSYSITFRKDTMHHSIIWTDGLDSTGTYIEMYRLLRSFASGKK